MTTFIFKGYFTTNNPDGTATSLKASKLEVVVDGSDAVFRYTREPGDDAIIATGNITALRIDGRDVGSIASVDTYISQISWGTTEVSNVLVAETPEGNFTMQISGNPIPKLTSAADYNGFLATIVKIQTLTWGRFGPDTDIPYTDIMNAKFTENDRIDGTSEADVFQGGIGKDKLNGADGNDKLDGGSGNDKLYGGDGKDTLNGGKGDDKLVGGGDKDTLIGGKGADSFVFQEVSDSTGKSKQRDVIQDFKRGQDDRIDLKGIDAKAGTKKNNGFTFIGKDDFSGRKGELRFEKKNGDTFVYGDVDGDAKVDFAIQLKGSINLIDDDFVL